MKTIALKSRYISIVSLFVLAGLAQVTVGQFEFVSTTSTIPGGTRPHVGETVCIPFYAWGCSPDSFAEAEDLASDARDAIADAVEFLFPGTICRVWVENHGVDVYIDGQGRFCVEYDFDVCVMYVPGTLPPGFDPGGFADGVIDFIDFVDVLDL